VDFPSIAEVVVAVTFMLDLGVFLEVFEIAVIDVW